MGSTAVHIYIYVCIYIVYTYICVCRIHSEIGFQKQPIKTRLGMLSRQGWGSNKQGGTRMERESIYTYKCEYLCVYI